MESFAPNSSLSPVFLKKACHSCISTSLKQCLICEPSQWTTNILKCTQNGTRRAFLLIKPPLTATDLAFMMQLLSVFAELSQHICTCRLAHDESNVKTEGIPKKQEHWTPFFKTSISPRPNIYGYIQSNTQNITIIDNKEMLDILIS